MLSLGAVAVDAPVCEELAVGILKQNGSAVDAAITALLCLGNVFICLSIFTDTIT